MVHLLHTTNFVDFKCKMMRTGRTQKKGTDTGTSRVAMESRKWSNPKSLYISGGGQD